MWELRMTRRITRHILKTQYQTRDQNHERQVNTNYACIHGKFLA